MEVRLRVDPKRGNQHGFGGYAPYLVWSTSPIQAAPRHISVPFFDTHGRRAESDDTVMIPEDEDLEQILHEAKLSISHDGEYATAVVLAADVQPDRDGNS